MGEIPFIQSIIDQLWTWVFGDETVMIVVGVFVLVIGLSFWGARRMETN